MALGSTAREVFEPDFVDHYGGTREHEVKLWNEAVTDWEGAYHSVAISTLKRLTDNAVERYLELA